MNAAWHQVKRVIRGAGIGVDRRARSVGSKYAMEADQVQPRTGNQRGESLHEFQRRHHQVGRAISRGCLQCEHHLCRAQHVDAINLSEGYVAPGSETRST